MLGGPVLGAALHERRVQEEAARTPPPATDLLTGLREKAGLLLPPPRTQKEAEPERDDR